MGLLLSHNCTVSIYKDMVVFGREIEGNNPGGGKRSEVYEFTASSRKRLLELLHQITYKSVKFVTLTYPAEYPHEWKIYKANLRAFRERLERKFGKLRVVWRLEYQKRGAPHYHLLIFDAPFLPVDWLSLAWAQVCKTGDPNHERCGVDLEAVLENGDAPLVALYAAKYAAKVGEKVEGDDIGKTGRHWGRWNIEKEAPRKFILENWEAVAIAIECFSSRGSADTWRPSDYTRATCFGGSMGSDNFERFVTRLVTQGSTRGRGRGA